MKKGQHMPEEMRAKDSARMKAYYATHNSYWKGKHLSPETRRKLSEAHRKRAGWHHSQETKTKLHIIMNSPEVKEKIASKLRGMDNPFYGKHHTDESIAKVRRAKAVWYENPDNRKRALEAGYKGWLTLTKQLQRYLKDGLPNPSERTLFEIIEAVCPGEYRYNNGWFMLAGKLPDFPNVNGKKKVIELFGEGYHKEKEVEHRKAIFAQFGWDTLIIWAKELKDREHVGNRIKVFTEA